MENPKLALIPSGYKSGKVYSILPTDGVGDFDFSRGSTATRVNKDGLIETVNNNVPRLDWLNRDCPSLLLEPQRTNIVYPNTSLSVYSINNGSKSDNVITSPDGENNGSLVQSNGGGTCVIYRSFGTATNTTYNISVFLKKGNYNNIRLQEGFTGSRIVVDLSNGTEVASNNATNKKIEDYGNGWYRVSFNYTSHSSTTIAQYSVYIEGSTASGNTFYTFGGQIEQGSYATSHIKTISNTITRQKDICINGGDSDLFNITEGTFFVDVTPYIYPSANTYISLNDGSSSNRFVFIFQSSGTQVRLFGVSSGVNFLSNYQTITFNQKNKIAITFKQNEFKIYVNGVLKHTDTSGNVPIGLNQLDFTENNGNRNFQGKVHDTRVYDRILTQDEAIELTTI